jgi:hypothetical protein
MLNDNFSNGKTTSSQMRRDINNCDNNSQDVIIALIPKKSSIFDYIYYPYVIIYIGYFNFNNNIRNLKL